MNDSDFLTKEAVIELGFEPIPHFTVTGTLQKDIGRNRFLSLGCVGTPNEMLWVLQFEGDVTTPVDDLVCLWNYDYDGRLTIGKLKQLLEFFTN